MNKNTHQLANKGKAGFLLQTVFILLMLISLAAILIMQAVHNHGRAVRRAGLYDQCLLDAQSGLEQIKYEILQAYSTNLQNGGGLEWFQNWQAYAIGTNPVYTLPPNLMINNNEVRVGITGVTYDEKEDNITLNLMSVARSTELKRHRIIHESLVITGLEEYGLLPFDYAYLLNSSGRLKSSMQVNGEVRVNGDFTLNLLSTLNGGCYASGRIYGSSISYTLVDYWLPLRMNAQARPSNPAAPLGVRWPMGYSDLRSGNYSRRPVYPYPFIDIPSLAAVASGTIKRGSTILAQDFYNGPGPDGKRGTADDGCLILDGASTPLDVSGMIVVAGDVVIRGKIRGQAIIYAGRNIHITGNLTYNKQPSWPKPDYSPSKTAKNNASRDALILAAKGNIVVGNYTARDWVNNIGRIMKDEDNIEPYTVTASDAALGYDSDNNPANGYLFNGRYFDNEAHGGQRLSGKGTSTVPRKYYESSMADTTISAVCDGNNVPEINAALLAGHSLIGQLGTPGFLGISASTTVNGAIVCRKDLTAYYGGYHLNWDIRLGSQSKDYLNSDILKKFIVEEDFVAKTTGWREVK